MAKSTSKFLSYQDQTGSVGVSDVCEDLPDVPEVANCPTCVKNPNAIQPHWTSYTINEPFLNEKVCLYQVTVQTDKSSTGGSTDISELEANTVLFEIFEEYKNQAVISLLRNFNKERTPKTEGLISDNIEFSAYSLDPRPSSKLVLLYSLEFDILNSLNTVVDDSESESDVYPEDEEEDSSGDSAGSKVVAYEVEDLKEMLMRARKGLHLYSRFYRVYSAVDAGSLVFTESEKLFTHHAMDRYGDNGFGQSILRDAFKQLDQFLSSKKLTLTGLGGGKVLKLSFEFNSDYRLIALSVWSKDCSTEPIIFTSKRGLKTLNSYSAWRDQTAMGYWANLEAMNTDLTAREPKPWIDFMVEHTYPKIASQINFPANRADFDKGAGGSCVAEALTKEGKQLGQDVLDDVFSIGDALALAFHKNLCKKKSQSHVNEEFEKLGLTNRIQKGYKQISTIKAAAREQAYKTLDAEDQVFMGLCTGLAGAGTLRGSDLLDELFDQLHKIKLCGLNKLLLEVSGCLFGNLTLEEGLASIVGSALKAMNLDNFEQLFIGLDPVDQAAIHQLAQAKLRSGDLFGHDSNLQDISDYETSQITPPFLDNQLKEAAKQDQVEGSYETQTPKQNRKKRRQTRRQYILEHSKGYKDDGGTLAAQFSAEKSQNELSPFLVMDAYIYAIVERYRGRLLEVVDMLNQFPGAQLIANFLLSTGCVQPPIMAPNAIDFLKSIDLPFCRNSYDIALPMIKNPYGWLPRIKDFSKVLFQALMLAIQQALIAIMMKLMIKLCELISSAACKAIEVGGDLVMGLPTLMGEPDQFFEIIKSSLCGEEASAEQVDNAIAELFQNLGTGANVLSDADQLKNFAEDMSSNSTRKELTDAFLGDCTPEFLTAMEQLIQYEYPEYRESFPNKQSICDFFKGVGNVFPADVKDAMKDFSDAIPNDDVLPANPSICLSPEKVEEFCELRQQLMAGRATPEQISIMCENARGDMLRDLSDIQDILQNGIPNFIDSNMPEIMSDPGCDNGIMPYEDPQGLATSVSALNNDLEALKVAYSKDMLNNGPGEKNWGLINMILSDTYGKPYTSHMRKSFNDDDYVDFYVSNEGSISGFPLLDDQKGAYPMYVAEWMQQQMLDMEISYNSNNNTVSIESDANFITKTFEELGITTYSPNEFSSIPGIPYDSEISVNVVNETITFTKRNKKTDADLTLNFRDNAKGLAPDQNLYSYGFDIGFYNCDYYDNGEAMVNLFADNSRITITNVFNPMLNLDKSAEALIEDESRIDFSIPSYEPIKELKYEFLASTSLLSEIDMSDYTNFQLCFTTTREYEPPVYLLAEILEKENDDYQANYQNLVTLTNGFVNVAMKKIVDSVADNQVAFLYGAEYDQLQPSDTDYVVKPDQTLSEGETLYSEARVRSDYGDGRLIQNDDMILGISRMQYEVDYLGRTDENRVFYLEPGTYGGSYVNPPVHVKPVLNEGWLGLVKLLFPDISACKPHSTDLVSFEDIQDRTQTNYNSIPEDDRLENYSDCTIELPYDKILDRSSAAGIENLIYSLLRIHCTVHVIKSLATFTVFEPNFSENFDSIYTSYIIRDLKESLMDPDGDGPEAISVFKDEDFYYLFIEQCVQMYSRKLDSGQIIDPEPSAIRAFQNLNRAQKDYSYPTKESLKQAKSLGDVRRTKTLKNYRLESKIQFLKTQESYALEIVRHLISEEMNIIGRKVIENLKPLNMDPKIANLGYYLLENFVQGSSALTLNKEIVEETVDLPTEGEELYTYGGEFAVAEVPDDGYTDASVNDEYVGYYHVHVDEMGNSRYMSGEFHIADPHLLLQPYGDKIIVPIGSVANYESEENNYSTEQPFVLEKYISINGVKYNPETALEIIKLNNNDLNISDVYPGTLELVYDPGTIFEGDSGIGIRELPANPPVVVGIRGELGVKYGLQISIIDSEEAQEKRVITSVEMGVLDKTIGEIIPLENDSKNLFCLVKMLSENDKFKLLHRYIFPLNKLLSLTAIYNDMAFLPSIGEVTRSLTSTSKAGMSVAVSQNEDGAADLEYSFIEGWENIIKRSTVGGNGIFWLHFDKWDQVLLRKSNKRAKRMFRKYYNSINLKAPDFGIKMPSFSMVNRLKRPFMPKAGQQLFPWWKRNRIRNNPFNSKNELCKSKDEDE